MSDIQLPDWRSVHTIVFDFDGVFTDNKVWTDQNGQESVCCDRGDGLAFDILRKFIRLNSWSLNYFILSRELNPVVMARANKLNVPCIQGSSDKVSYLHSYLKDADLRASGLIYVGNDLNDLGPILLSGYSVVPSDAHPLIKQHSSLTLPQKGGDGFVRAFIEKLIRLDKITLNELQY